MRLHLVDLASATLADGTNSALAPRDAALLAWLALEGPTPRSRLAELLWPESEHIRRARLSVPMEFRDSFLRRNPMHRELIDWPR
jgi:hypothetical protein